MDNNFSTKYRPHTFAEVVGQEIPKAVLKRIALAQGVSCRSIFLKGAYGCGKCVLGNTRVATSNGYLPIQQVFEGHYGFNDFITEVYTRQGIRKSSHWYKEANCMVIKHKCANGFELNGTADHRVLAYHNNRVDLHRMGDLTVGDTILFPKKFIGENWNHIPELAYATGLWLGDGYTNNGVMGFCGTRAMCEKFAHIVGWNGALSKDNRREDLYVVRPLKSDNSLINLKGHSIDKEIPEYIFCSDVESRIAFIQGLLETDGTINSSCDVEWTMNSEKLIKQLQELLFTMGVSAHVASKITTCGEYRGLAWRLRIPASQSCFDLSKNGRIWSHEDSMNDRNIIKVDAQFICDAIRRHRVGFSHRFKGDLGTKLSGNVKVWGAVTERSLIKYKEFYGELPEELEGLIGYNYEPIVDTSFTSADVYDLTVPDVHEFYCQGTYNHNTTLARIFASAMNCEHFKETGDICNTCTSCLDTQASNSQLYMEFDATVAGNVDAIRALHDKLGYLPQDGKRRVVVLDEVHSCSSAALNALLKIVEEGVPDTIFVFCSTEDILPTLKSRSICLDITGVPHGLMAPRVEEVARIENVQITPEIVDAICIKSQGHMRDAMSLLQLYSLAGEAALKSPLKLVQKFIFEALQRNREEANVVIPEILKFPVTDVAISIATFITLIYKADNTSPLYPLLQKGFANKLFSFFYTPLAQTALKSEAGTELLLRSFIEKTNG